MAYFTLIYQPGIGFFEFKRFVSSKKKQTPTIVDPTSSKAVLISKNPPKKVDLTQIEPKSTPNSIFNAIEPPVTIPTQNRISLFPAKPFEPHEKRKQSEPVINILFRFTSILKAINLLRMRTFYRPIKYVNEQQIELIKDTSCFISRQQENDMFVKRFLEKNVIFLKKTCYF